ncbi:hypothetical protein V3C99_005152 [Haemonchus contortus]|uniref:Ovule protein n=1 Tax=Haemonchus contortus TaxID=6289 RepID=A0A7I4XWA0_HAECO
MTEQEEIETQKSEVKESAELTSIKEKLGHAHNYFGQWKMVRPGEAPQATSVFSNKSTLIIHIDQTLSIPQKMRKKRRLQTTGSSATQEKKELMYVCI